MFVWLVCSMFIDVVARLEHTGGPQLVIDGRGPHHGLPGLLDWMVAGTGMLCAAPT